MFVTCMYFIIIQVKMWHTRISGVGTKRHLVSIHLAGVVVNLNLNFVKFEVTARKYIIDIVYVRADTVFDSILLINDHAARYQHEISRRKLVMWDQVCCTILSLCRSGSC